MSHTQIIGSDGKGNGLQRAIHLRISETEASQLEAHAERLAAERKTKVSVSEAARDLMARGLQQNQKPWEMALKSLSFVTWQGGKPILPHPKGVPEGKALSAVVLEGREDPL
ncbi:MAG: hypothetical protein Q8K67_12605 [Geothrix sp.]|nr:hypothetical protein [Geothrix sp.]